MAKKKKTSRKKLKSVSSKSLPDKKNYNMTLIGMSHVEAVKSANDNMPDSDIKVINIGLAKYKNDGKFDTKKFSDQIAGEKLFLSLEGNYHSILGIIKHERPFDFIYPNIPLSSLQKDSFLIPYSSMRLLFEEHFKKNIFEYIDNIKKNLPNKELYFIEPPSPIPEEEHIKKYPKDYFKEKIKNGITPKLVRWKLWHLHNDIIKSFCKSQDIKYISMPKDTNDEEGFLKECYWNNDPTHANKDYGMLVIEQMRSL